MKQKFWYVFHFEQMPSGVSLLIYEPFEFETREKAQIHADFFKALNGIHYSICNEVKYPII